MTGIGTRTRAGGIEVETETERTTARGVEAELVEASEAQMSVTQFYGKRRLSWRR